VVAGALPRELLRILVEVVEPSACSAAARADEIRMMPGGGWAAGPTAIAGEGETCWPLAGHAERLGLPARIGLADVTAGPDGDPAASNADLVLGSEVHNL
jgi:uncharacterized protein (DUF849 family)